MDASDGRSLDQFANNLDVDGPFAIVAARGHDRTGLTEGAAYIFDWTTGAELHKLTPSQPTQFMDFGQGLSMQGSVAVVGVPRDDSDVVEGGKAFVYDLVLSTTRLPVNQLGIDFMGDQHAQATPMGNGLRCASGLLVRYGVRSTVAGSISLGPGIVSATDVSLAATGGITARTSWTFQFWCRDQGSPCTATSNTSSALTVLFTL